MQNVECKMQNEGVALGDLFQSFPQKIPQFCTLHFEFCISCVSTINCNLPDTYATLTIFVILFLFFVIFYIQILFFLLKYTYRLKLPTEKRVIMREFFGFGGYQRPAEGFLSWQHLVFVSSLMVIMIGLAVFLGLRYKNALPRQKNRVLIWAAFLIDGFELLKIVLLCFRANDPMNWLYNLPLFLCSIQLIAIPLAAFSKGRIKEAALDFVCIFGILGAVLGTYGAGQNYGCYPVLSFDNVVSGLTHSIAGFASLYILISGMASLKRKNIGITFGILLFFCVAAYIANCLLDYNYMFLMAGDGTPYDILYNLVGGHKVIYPVSVVALFILYIGIYYGICQLVRNKKRAKAAL